MGRRKKSDLHKNPKMLPGDKLGNLTCMGLPFMVRSGQRSRPTAVFDCECGERFISRVSAVLTGETVSCGCSKPKRLKTHGLTKHPAYKVWYDMLNRCGNPGATGYEYYGGRGISVCNEWMDSPEPFIAWAESNGFRRGLHLDREENSGDYTPENCRFVAPSVNMLNKRSNVLVTALGETKTVTEWSRDERCPVSYNTLKQRLYSGVAPEEAVITPTGGLSKT